MIRVLIVDDNMTVRQEIQARLEAELDINVVGLAENGEEAIAQVGAVHPNVVLMEIALPVMDGQAATRQIMKQYPQCKVLIFTSWDDKQSMGEALQAGAKGYLLRDIDSMAQSIRLVYQGYELTSPGTLKKLMEWAAENPLQVSRKARSRSAELSRADFNRLTVREQQILRAMSQGMNNREIAASLVLSVSTVRTHVSNMLSRLHLRDRLQLQSYANYIFADQPHETPE
jgi:DNA-binding NarL/FixJ family response regulator